jgi:hypothetical protein
MTHPDHDIIGSKPTPKPIDELPLFATSSPETNTAPESAGVSNGRREPRPDDHAKRAAQSDDAEQLLVEATRCANAILDATRRVAVWEVRLQLQRMGKIANDGTEKLAALGGLGQRMGLVAVGVERAPAGVLPKSHSNRHTVWARPKDAHVWKNQQGAA